jgi:hypothetical protein
MSCKAALEGQHSMNCGVTLAGQIEGKDTDGCSTREKRHELLLLPIVRCRALIKEFIYFAEWARAFEAGSTVQQLAQALCIPVSTAVFDFVP